MRWFWIAVIVAATTVGESRVGIAVIVAGVSMVGLGTPQTARGKASEAGR